MDRKEIALGYSLFELFLHNSESTVELGHIPADGLLDDVKFFYLGAVIRRQTASLTLQPPGAPSQT